MQDYQDFISYLDGKNYSYTTDTEKELNKLVKTAKKEKYWDMAETQFDQLDTVLKSKKNQDLQIFKDQIEEILENEIVSRYYYQKGRIESSLASDKAVKKAIEVLNNSSEYDAILKPV